MPEITKRRVTMRSVSLSPDGKTTLHHEAVDYVRPDHLDAYVADARTRWQSVEVSDEPDAALTKGTGARADTKTDTTTTVWLSGGTLDAKYQATNHITTAQGREEDETLTVLIVNQ